ncbi:hypothetical protein JCM8547_008062 [Rhodosporidiobolus lusitaniae]
MLLRALPRNSGPSSSTSVFLLFLAFFFGGVSVHGQATINSPASVTECLPQQLTVSGGEPPYTIQVLPGGATGGEPLETLPTVEEEGSVRWVCDIAAGQNITFAVRDNSGVVNFSSEVPVLEGTSTDCIGQNSAAEGSATVTSGSAASSASDASSASSGSNTSGSASASGSSRSNNTSVSASSTSATRSSSTVTLSAPTATQTQAQPVDGSAASKAGVFSAFLALFIAVSAAVFF